MDTSARSDGNHSHPALEHARSSGDRYRTLVEHILDYAIVLLDADGVITEWTPGAERVTGYSAAEAIGQHLSLFYQPEDVASGEPARELADAASSGRVEREGWHVRKGGDHFWADAIITTVRDRDGRLLGFARITRDVTERREDEAAGRHARSAAERDVFRRHLIQAEDDERRRLARELHDEAGQHLTALGLGLRALADVAPPGSEVDRRAASLRAIVDVLGRELHEIAVRLRPKALDDFGLEPVLVAFAEEWSRRTGIPIQVRVRAGETRLPDVVESALYRVVQEALTNVARHSGASHAALTIEQRDGHVRAVVVDDGAGFDARSVEGEPASGLGLLGIRERVALLGGSTEIETAPDAGTTLFVRIPLGPAASRGGRSIVEDANGE